VCWRCIVKRDSRVNPRIIPLIKVNLSIFMQRKFGIKNQNPSKLPVVSRKLDSLLMHEELTIWIFSNLLECLLSRTYDFYSFNIVSCRPLFTRKTRTLSHCSLIFEPDSCLKNRILVKTDLKNMLESSDLLWIFNKNTSEKNLYQKLNKPEPKFSHLLNSLKLLKIITLPL